MQHFCSKLINKAFSGLFYFFASIGALIGLGVVACFLFFVMLLAGIYFEMQPKNVSRLPQYQEIYDQTFEVQQDLFLLQWSDTKKLYLKTWEQSDSLARVEKGTKIHVNKIVLRNNPFAGKSLEVLVDILDPKLSANHSKKIDAHDLLINYLRLPYNEGIALFHPDYLRNSEIRTLHLAVQYHDLKAVKNLLEKGADINQKNFDGKTPLHYARDINIAEFLIKQGAGVNHADKWGSTLLHYVANDTDNRIEDKYLDIVKLLTENGANLDQKDGKGDTPLLIAADGKNYRVVELLLKSGADPRVKGRYENTIFLQAAQDDQPDVVELSIKLGADPLAKSALSNMTALHYAARNNDRKIAKYLIQAGVPVNSVNDYGATPLYYAYDNLQMLQLLIENGADIHHVDQKGRTIFHETCDAGNVQTCKFLYEKGSQINLGDKEGITPLYLAVNRGDTDMVQWLVNHGASKTSADHTGVTPLDLAKRDQRNDLISVLKQDL